MLAQLTHNSIAEHLGWKNSLPQIPVGSVKGLSAVRLPASPIAQERQEICWGSLALWELLASRNASWRNLEHLWGSLKLGKVWFGSLAAEVLQTEALFSCLISQELNSMCMNICLPHWTSILDWDSLGRNMKNDIPSCSSLSDIRGSVRMLFQTEVSEGQQWRSTKPGAQNVIRKEWEMKVCFTEKKEGKRTWQKPSSTQKHCYKEDGDELLCKPSKHSNLICNQENLG